MASPTRFLPAFALLAFINAPIASAQTVISAKSGLIHYTEGQVFLEGKAVALRFGEFPTLGENQELRTEDGRAEVLLTPGVFLRVGEDSGVRMTSARLSDTRLALVSGVVLLQIDELFEGNTVTFTYGEYAIRFLKSGIYRLTAAPPELRVYGGEASVDRNGETRLVKNGRALVMSGDLQVAKFDGTDIDELYRWSRHRSEYLAMANLSSTNALRNSGTYWGVSGWYWNPYFGMYTFIPPDGMFYDPWGFAYWSPFTVYRYVSSYWPEFYYAPGESSSGSGGGSKPPAAASNTGHHGGRIGHPPLPRTPGGEHPTQHGRGVSVAADAHRSVSAGGGSHHGGFSAGAAHAAGFSSGSGHSGGSSGGSAHSSSGGSSSAGSSGGGGHSSGGSASSGSSGGGGHK